MNIKIEIPHLRDNNISYLNHLRRGIRWSLRLGIANSALVVHSFLPFVLTKTASSEIYKINNEMSGFSCKKHTSGV